MLDHVLRQKVTEWLADLPQDVVVFLANRGGSDPDFYITRKLPGTTTAFRIIAEVPYVEMQKENFVSIVQRSKPARAEAVEPREEEDTRGLSFVEYPYVIFDEEDGCWSSPDGAWFAPSLFAPFGLVNWEAKLKRKKKTAAIRRAIARELKKVVPSWLEE
jgi:glycogen debranching enzyme